MTTQRPAVLFLCVHNAGRSQMAAGWLRQLAGNRVDIFSAGTEPADQLNPVAVEAMSEVGIDISAAQPQLLTPELAREVDVVVTMGCGDTCPHYPGKRYQDWPLTDPAGQPLDVVRQVRDQIRDRVQDLANKLLTSKASRGQIQPSGRGYSGLTRPSSAGTFPPQASSPSSS